MTYDVRTLIDVPTLQQLTDQLYRAAGIPSALITPDGEILTQSGWQTICTQFHRRHPIAERECVASDTKLREEMLGGTRIAMYRCPHGLLDACSPVLIEGTHIANVFVGQVLIEAPTLEVEQQFRKQAEDFGFDEVAYLGALKDVPVYPEAQFRSALSFIAALAEFLANAGLARKRELESRARLNDGSSLNKEIISNLREGLIVYDRDLRYRVWNSFMEQLTGLPASQVLGRHALEVFPFLKEAGVHDRLLQALQGDHPDESVFWYTVASNGRSGWAIDKSAPFKNAQGEIVGVIGTVQDITARKETEDQLRLSENELQKAQRVAHVGTWTLDIKANKLTWSDEMYRIFGIDKATFKGSLDSVLGTCIHPDDRSIVERSNNSASGLGKSGPLEYRVVHQDGSVHHVWAETGDLVLDSHGAPSTLSGIVQEITDRRKAEDARMKLEVQLFQAQRMEGIGTLASGIAHDFNNILHIILGNLSGLERVAGDPAKLGKRIDAITNASERATHLVKQLLTYARKTEVKRTSVVVNDLILDTVKLLGETLPKTIVISLELDPHLPKVMGDGNQLHQVFLNVALNAKDAMASGGELRFSTSVTPGLDLRLKHPKAGSSSYITIRIKDTGLGMDEKTCAQVFDPFFTTKEIGKGTGLGLSVAQGIIQSHEGFIEVQSSIGVGSTFSIHLPVTGIVHDETGPALSANASISRGTETILFIEDERQTRETASEYLSELGYSVILAADGDEGIREFAKHNGAIDLVLCDYGLPVFTGEEVFTKIREMGKDVPFILVSGFLEPDTRTSILSKGVTLIVQKPYKPGDILTIIRRILDEAALSKHVHPAAFIPTV
ncbi:MAG TPA: PocR ligand-binding domain-containing protein [Bacteroidota bacterium]|nr:PocR ligand-binding domain-containing protein [Bacteroidota bacterium]